VKTLRHACAAIILTLALAVSALAGEIDCPGVVAKPTPPPQLQIQTTATVTGTITSTVILVIIDLIP
jgi:hypothetical protein